MANGASVVAGWVVNLNRVTGIVSGTQPL